MKDYSVLDGMKRDQCEKFELAYDKGYKHGYLDGKDEAYKNPVPTQDAYQRGLEDAWECAKKIALNKLDGGIDVDTLSRIFGVGKPYNIMKNFSSQEVISKIKALEEKQEQVDDEIKIGDEVNAPGFHVPVVVIASYDDDSLKVMNSFGDTGVYSKINVTKTGRHFPEIAEVFKAMQEGKE